jgi:Domain of unknown function (DUF4367)
MRGEREEIDRLEYDVQLLSQAMVFPSTPSFAGRVRSRIEAEREVRAPAPSWQLALTAAAAALVGLAFLAGVLAPARNAVADLFDSINIFETDEVPADLTRDITGTPVSLEAAEATLGRPIRLPTYPEESTPERVLLQDFGQVKAAVLFFEHPDGTRFALFETNAGVGKGLPAVGKGIAGEAQAEPVPGLGSEAYWLTGLRIVQYYDLEGSVIQDSVRATDVNTLLWGEDGYVFRIESDLTQEEAIKIAKSLE